MSYGKVVVHTLHRARDSVLDIADPGLELPRRADRLLGAAERGNLRMLTRVEDAELLLKRLERIGGRTNAPVLTSACIVALAIVVLAYQPQGWHRWIGAVFWIGVVAAATAWCETPWHYGSEQRLICV